MTVVYEWDVETVATVDTDDLAEGDIIDHWHTTSYQRCMRHVERTPVEEGQALRVVLVRDDDAGRSWAYVENGKFLGPFEDANGCTVCAVPIRFVREVFTFHVKESTK